MPQAPSSHVILLEWPLGRNSGGPSGYLWHLRCGIERAGLTDCVTFVTAQNSGGGGKSKRAKWIDKTAKISEGLWRLLKTYGPTNTSRELSYYLNTPIANFEAPQIWNETLSNQQYRTFHCHTTFDCLRVHNSLIRLGRRKETRLFLTSHCPEMPGDEKADLMRTNGLTVAAEKAVRSKLLEIDAAAFACADSLIFPCPDALEPYKQNFSAFEKIIAEKDMRYVFTGIDEPPRGPAATGIFPEGDVLKLFYAGRHNAVKGYDLLINTVPDFLDKTNAVMVVAGKQGPLFAPAHPKWKELEWINNAPDIIAQADVFLLPNACTYFDIIALEVLALGRPLLASRTGGNKALAPLSSGVILFDPNSASLTDALKKVAALSSQERQDMGQANRAAYDKFFSAEIFAKNYVAEVVEK